MKRQCTRCLRTEPDCAFISSSGEWCIECIARLRAEEADKRLWGAYPWLYADRVPKERNQPTLSETSGVKERKRRTTKA